MLVNKGIYIFFYHVAGETAQEDLVGAHAYELFVGAENLYLVLMDYYQYLPLLLPRPPHGWQEDQAIHLRAKTI